MAGTVQKLSLILLLASLRCSALSSTTQEGKKPAHRCVALQRGSCPAGWREWGEFCYKTLDGIFSWEAATTTACTKIGGWLAVPHTAEENALILSMSVEDAEGVWVNCNDLKEEGAWECIEQGNKIYDLRHFWGVAEPNNAAGKENCAVIEKTDGKWHDVYCDYKDFSVVCKRSAPGVLLINS